jgi:predicted acetyltransferase
MKSILWSEIKRSTIEIHDFRALSHPSTCDFANVFLLGHDSSLENSMHPNIPVSGDVRLFYTMTTTDPGHNATCDGTQSS